MRVVCDNCGAVYKIGDSKLVKDVNKATCKRCGHKIMIFRGGVNDHGDDTAHSEDHGSEDGDERTVIRNVSDLDQLSRSQGAVPSIGSLTAELRAISLPGIPPAVGPAPPQNLGPLGPPPGPPPYSAPPHVPAPPPPMPAPKLSPAPPPPPAMRPMDASRPVHAPIPEAPRGGHGLTPPPIVPPMGASARPPTRDDLRGVGHPPPMAAPPHVMGAATNPNLGQALNSTAMALQAATGISPGAGSAELGALGGVGMIGLLGVVASIAAPFPVSAVGVGLAAFSVGTTLFLPLLSERGRKAGRTPLAMGLGLVIGGALAAAAYQRAHEVDANDGLAGTLPSESAEPREPAPPPDLPAPTPAPLVPTPPSPTPAPAPAAGLSSAEREALRASQAIPVPQEATPERVAAVTKPPPREPPAATPAPPREVKQPPKEPTHGVKEPVAPSPPGDSGSKASGGPTPFVIDTMIRTNASVLRCFSAEKAKGADVSGKIYLKFSIAPEGGVSRARITTSRFAGTDLDSCVSREVNALRFPAFEGQTQQVTYPFIVN